MWCLLMPPGRRTISEERDTLHSSLALHPPRLGKHFLSVTTTVSGKLMERTIRACFRPRHGEKVFTLFGFYRPASLSTASQPKSIAVGREGTVFVAEISGVEAIRDNQKISELKSSYAPSAVATSKSFVAIGEVCRIFSCCL